MQRSVGDSEGLNSSRTWIRAQRRPNKAPSTSQTWKRNPTSNPGATKHPKDPSRTSLSLSDQQVKEAYRQLEINYRFKPQPTEAQMYALATVVELTYDQVRAFYQQKQSQPPSYISNSSQVNQVQGPSVSNPAKRHCGSDSSSSPELVDSVYGTYQSDSSASIQTYERNAISRAPNLSNQVREPYQKPYECTWQACQKSFASKSDWKRHEEVHCPQWYWVCTLESRPEEKSSTSIPCTRKFKRDDHLREHLKKDHKCADLSKVAAGRQPLIRKTPFKRQCGFCGQMTRDWLNRIDHIAEHFKNGRRMSEWRDPWPEDGFEEESDPGEDDDDDGDTDKNDNNNSTSNKQGDPRADSRKDNWKDGNNSTQKGRYQSSGMGYVRPGSFGIRYHAASRASDTTEGLKRRHDELHTDDADSFISFWSKMRNMLKNMKKQKRIASASSLGATMMASFEASRDGDFQDEERIEFYCILCLKLISMDPSLQNTDESYCSCSEAAIKEHIQSLTNSHPGLLSPGKSEDSGRSEPQVPKTELGPDVLGEGFDKDKVFKRHLLHAVGGHMLDENVLKRLATLNEAQWQTRAAVDAQDESLSYSMRRYLKLNSPTEASSKADEDSQGNDAIRRLPSQEAAASFEK